MTHIKKPSTVMQMACSQSSLIPLRIPIHQASDALGNVRPIWTKVKNRTVSEVASGTFDLSKRTYVDNS